jgi:hypothetical protein
MAARSVISSCMARTAGRPLRTSTAAVLEKMSSLVLKAPPRSARQPMQFGQATPLQRGQGPLDPLPLAGRVEGGKVLRADHHGQDAQRRGHPERLDGVGDLQESHQPACPGKGTRTRPPGCRTGTPTAIWPFGRPGAQLQPEAQSPASGLPGADVETTSALPVQQSVEKRLPELLVTASMSNRATPGQS